MEGPSCLGLLKKVAECISDVQAPIRILHYSEVYTSGENLELWTSHHSRANHSPHSFCNHQNDGLPDLSCIKLISFCREESEPGAPAMGAKSLCTPFVQSTAIQSTDRCINPTCSNKPQSYTLFGRSY